MGQQKCADKKEILRYICKCFVNCHLHTQLPKLLMKYLHADRLGKKIRLAGTHTHTHTHTHRETGKKMPQV